MVVVLLIVGALVFVVACTSRVELPPKNLGSKVYFVPIGDFPTDQLKGLTNYCYRKFGLQVPVLRAIGVSASDLDRDRGPLVAEKLVTEMRTAFPELAADPNAVMIGLTSQDMYIAAKEWRFAFGWRDTDTPTAVVSTARMNLHYSDEPFWGSSAKIRLRKMVTKDIGILYYGLSQSDNAKSVLYKGILGIQELDAVGDDF
jgi:predicted Zn-dependent protease